MTRNSKQAVCSKEVPFLHHIGLNDAPFLGLTTIDCTAKRYGHDNTYSFLHLTFQEYLAARYVAHLEEKEQTEIIILLARHSHMQMVWMFYCGMVEFGDKPAQIELIMKNQLNMYDSLHKIHYAFESHQKIVCDTFIECSQLDYDLIFNGITLAPADLTAMGYVISSTPHPLHTSIRRCGLQKKHIKAFLLEDSTKELKNIKVLNLMHNTIGQDSAVALASALKSCAQLKQLNLSYNNIGPDGAVALASALKSCAQLKQLNLSYNNIGPDGAVALASALNSCAQLKYLNISESKY